MNHITYRCYCVSLDGIAQYLGTVQALCGSDARQLAFEKFTRNYDGLAVVAEPQTGHEP